MSVKYSTGLWDRMFGASGNISAYAPQTSGSLVVGTRYRISSFVAGDNFTNVGAGSNATGVDFICTGTTPTTWTNSSILTPLMATGGIKGALHKGFINIYSGPQPLTADTGANGTLLGTISVDATGVGLTFTDSSNGVIAKSTSETWKFLGVAAGTAGWGRFYPAGGNPAVLSTTESRIDFSIATSGADVIFSNVSIAVDAPNTMDTFTISKPA